MWIISLILKNICTTAQEGGAERRCRYVGGMNLAPGADIANQDGITWAEDCCKICLNNPACQGFAHHAPTSHCWQMYTGAPSWRSPIHGESPVESSKKFHQIHSNKERARNSREGRIWIQAMTSSWWPLFSHIRNTVATVNSIRIARDSSTTAGTSTGWSTQLGPLYLLNQPSVGLLWRWQHFKCQHQLGLKEESLPIRSLTVRDFAGPRLVAAAQHITQRQRHTSWAKTQDTLNSYCSN